MDKLSPYAIWPIYGQRTVAGSVNSIAVVTISGLAISR